jgi:formylglycine-generating enzyme
MKHQTSATKQVMKQAMKLGLGALALVVCVAAYGQAPVVGSLSKNGVLLCTNLVPGTVASVEWGPSVTGPWTNNWAGLDSVTVDSNGMIQVAVPMFYRVRGTGAPAGMALIPAGAFTMGDTLDGLPSAAPISVTVSAFYMDTNEVSYSQWTNVYAYATNHGYGFFTNTTWGVYQAAGKAWNHPVQTVNWYDCVKWSNARSEQADLTPVYYTDAGLTQVYTNGEPPTLYPNWAANGYRLPTEAEWEKAARGGLIGKRFPWGDTITHSQANYYSDDGYAYDISPTRGSHPDYADGDYPYTSPVGLFGANGYGLYDMAGNVYEWCWDWYETPYGQPTTTNPTGPAGPLNVRVLRGGNWSGDASFARCADRSHAYPGAAGSRFGLRCVRGF